MMHFMFVIMISDVRCIVLSNFVYKSDISVPCVLVWQRRYLCQWSRWWCYTPFCGWQWKSGMPIVY